MGLLTLSSSPGRSHGWRSSFEKDLLLGSMLNADLDSASMGGAETAFLFLFLKDFLNCKVRFMERRR